MQKPSLDYDDIAPEYNQRYPTSKPSERGEALLNLARQVRAQNILEVGSGTGFWLNLLHLVTSGLYGLDFSMGMIRQAKSQPAPLKLTRGAAIHLPYKDNSFELIYCVDAIHHFGDYKAFIGEACRVLKPGGALGIVGSDPHDGEKRWYVYDYFDTVYETDLLRFPSGEEIMSALKDTGFQKISHQIVEHILNVHVGDDVLNDPFLKHNATSQLALLNDELYQAGLRRIQQALADAEARDERPVFRSEIFIEAFTGYKLENKCES
jgi:ubiquinone/menaquinone biosynthesis C-methylase UbiE